MVSTGCCKGAVGAITTKLVLVKGLNVAESIGATNTPGGYSWPCILKSYLNDKPAGKYEEKANIAIGPIRFSFGSAFTSMLYAWYGSTHCPSAAKQPSSVYVSVIKMIVRAGEYGPNSGSSIYFQ